jgi:hypothetical protein
MSTYVMGEFKEVYKNPQRCVHEDQSCLQKKDMKDNVNASNTLVDG